MRHMGTTHKHSGSPKHTHHGHAKHNPNKEPQHHKDSKKTKGHTHHSGVHHAHKTAKSPKTFHSRGLGELPTCVPDAIAVALSLRPEEATALYPLLSVRHGATIQDTLAGLTAPSLTPVDLDDPDARLLGLDLPGLHTVAVRDGLWWSWGEWWCPCEFPEAIIEEAWA